MAKTLKESLVYAPVELTFGTSGLRGLVSDMTDLECYINTRGFIDYLSSIGDIKPGSLIALAADLRPSSPRILSAVAKGVTDEGYKIIYLGEIPIPAASYYGLQHGLAVAMVTGSHIPADRNGIKFYKRAGEVLKSDESDIKSAVEKFRSKIYASSFLTSIFDKSGSLKEPFTLPVPEKKAGEDFLERYIKLFQRDLLKDKQIVVYQHSSLAADMLVELLGSLGADVTPVDRSEEFIPIDTENITPENQQYFKSLARNHPAAFAIISADGDADRPFIVDEKGNFHRGDVVGALTAVFLKAQSASVPISASDAVDTYLAEQGVELTHTKIGSPYVISSMLAAAQKGLAPVVGWEVNGGFLTGSDIQISGKKLAALPTRDSFLPIICCLALSVAKKCRLSDLFAQLPPRFTQAGILDSFPVEVSQAILDKYSVDSTQTRQDLEKVFSPKAGFGRIINFNFLDGIRIQFDNNDVAHIRPSGNAPQLRIYATADTQKRADSIVVMALKEPDGLLRKLEMSVSQATV